jgi:hypothetical protein
MFPQGGQTRKYCFRRKRYYTQETENAFGLLGIIALLGKKSEAKFPPEKQSRT